MVTRWGCSETADGLPSVQLQIRLVGSLGAYLAEAPVFRQHSPPDPCGPLLSASGTTSQARSRGTREMSADRMHPDTEGPETHAVSGPFSFSRPAVDG